MSDAGDQVVSDHERAMALFEQQRLQRIAESMRPRDPNVPVDCIDCGEIIRAERLEAYPHTRRCTRCSALVEQGYRERWPL
ncbi:TraR/DksA C4-type zinc finger protein [Luteimonas soli]|uniref:TraR/DksA C4-type zinc finger protein n=1 Tax=Luteimonas soli TaxID=1648966 RepID=A0ABV7XKX6_9GAMM